MKKQLLLLVMMLLPIFAYADKSGTCGDNLTWTLNESTGTLTISGSGTMTNYGSSDYVPWYNYRTKILTVVIGDGVTSIGNYAFYYCSSLTSVTIGNSVTTIGDFAFYDCSSLTSVTIPNSVTSIGERAFKGCDKISNVNISVSDFAAFCNNRIIYLIHNALSNPTNVTISLFDSEGKEIQDYIIPDGVTTIPIYAFYNCSSLKSIEIPNSVTSIGSYAFYNCSSLTSVTIGNSVTSIGNLAFYNCSSLTSIEIPNSVTSIWSSAFYDCSGLTSIEIPNSVTNIGSYAFYGTGWYNKQDDGILYLCNWLLGYKGKRPTGDVKIANGTKGIGSEAFSGCSSLTSIEIPNSVTSIADYAFSSCSSLTSIEIPNSVTSIGYYAFSYCSGLISVTIPNSVTSIGANAFYQCTHLASVTLSKNLNSIGSSAFQDCGRLSNIYCLNPIPPSTNDDTFICRVNDYVRDKNDIYNYAILNVPKGSKDAYSSASEWRYFKNIREIGGDSEQSSYANLTIQLGTTGFTRQSVKTMESYTFYIGSYGNNKVNAVTFNGEDVTNRINNGYYTTPEITGASILSVTYETTASAIQAMKQSNLKVIGFNGEINVDNIDSVSDVTVYTVDGKLVDSIPSVIGSVRLQVPTNQLYIVKVANRTFKLAM